MSFSFPVQSAPPVLPVVREAIASAPVPFVVVVTTLLAAMLWMSAATGISPASLPTLHIIAFIPAVLIFFSHLVHGRHAVTD